MEDKKIYLKEYYAKNKDSIKEKMKEKIVCECGEEYTRYNKNNHEKTAKHIYGLEKNKDAKINERTKKLVDEKVKKIFDEINIDNIREKITHDILSSILKK